jgi:CheY-like chemotaxis protein
MTDGLDRQPDCGDDPENAGQSCGDSVAAILLAEDDEAVREFVKRALAHYGHSVTAVGDGGSALAALEDAAYDLLLTDIVMPGLNGRELADQLHHRQSGLRVLFMTGYSRDAIVHQGRLDAGVLLLQKPVTQALLAAKIREILDKS